MSAAHRTLAALLALGSALGPRPAEAQLAPRPRIDAYTSAGPMPGAMAGRVPAGLSIVGRDEQRGVPTFLIGRAPLPSPGAGSPTMQAAVHLARLAPLYGIGPRALFAAEVALRRRTAAGGALVVFGQRVGGVEVYGTRLSLLLDASGALVAAGGQLRPTAPSYSFGRDAESAARAALADHFGSSVGGASPVARAPAQRDGELRFALNAAGLARGYSLDRPLRVARVLFPLPSRLVPAHYVELWASESASGVLMAYVVSAEDGSVLARHSLTSEDSFTYRVYSDALYPYQPLDSAFGDTSPDLTGAPVAVPPAHGPSIDVLIEGLNANPSGRPDPWLPAGATETIGNNVDAYADLVAPDGFGDGDLRGAVSRAGAFDYTYDETRGPNADETQQQASITHLFYVNNWLHDYFYGVGFDETAGNAQALNFGRGGREDDVLVAQANDYSRRNNANMSTPRDGASPRMQMFVWNGFTTAAVESGGTTFEVGTAAFGPDNYDITRTMALADDGTGTTTDACEAIVNDLTGRIALIDRGGGCSFIEKVGRAAAAGAVGVLIVNNIAGGVVSTLGGTGSTTIPALMVSLEDGATLGGATGASARMSRESRPDVPSALDSQVVAHEWGHYLHHRLVVCGSQQCDALSEGWGDYIALLVLMRDGDDLRGAYPSGSFSNQGSEMIYFGTRRVPYSANRMFNDLSFRHIADGEALPTTHPLDPTTQPNSEVHNAGEIWATMMFDATIALLERSQTPRAPYTFEEGMRRMAGYVVLGMQLTPASATFMEQRHAIVAAALETDLEDARLIATAFAGRGAGTCAVAPDRASEDFVGVVEDFELRPRPVIEALGVSTLGPGLLCDADDVLDAGETGEVHLTLRNNGFAVMSGVVLTLEADDASVGAVGGPTFMVPDLAPGARTELAVPIHVDEMAAVIAPVTVTATLSAESLCADVVGTSRLAVDRDVTLGDLEDFELEPIWFAESSLDGLTTGVWTIGPSVLGDTDWTLRGTDTGSITDSAVELPAFSVSTTLPLSMRLEHRFDFEGDATTLWDGGVIEVSRDGAAWTDVADFVDPGYTGQLTDRAENPLSLRDAYSGRNPSWPADDTVRLDFGMAFAGERLRFRFRIGTDQASGARGWEIDDIVISGADPLPFPTYTADLSDCADAPTASAGPDQEVFEGDRVTLDATGSTDPTMDTLTYAWEVLTADPALSLSDVLSATPEFTAPPVDAPVDLVFRVRASDGVGSSSDDVGVRVLPRPEPPTTDAGPPPPPRRDAGGPRDGGARGDAGMADAGDMGGGEGCSCESAGRREPSPLGIALLLVAALGVTRRRRS